MVKAPVKFEAFLHQPEHLPWCFDAGALNEWPSASQHSPQQAELLLPQVVKLYL